MMNDLISRQAAIDAFWKLDAEIRPSAIDKILNMLKGLPSAQPEETCDTCKYGYFGDGMCDNCRERYQSHYERRTDE